MRFEKVVDSNIFRQSFIGLLFLLRDLSAVKHDPLYGIAQDFSYSFIMVVAAALVKRLDDKVNSRLLVNDLPDFLEL